MMAAPSSWHDLLAQLAGGEDSALDVCALMPHHAHFVRLTQRDGDAAYYGDIPFVPVTAAMVHAAERYIRDPSLPAMIAIFPVKLAEDRFRVLPGDRIAKASQPLIDSLIVTASACLPRKTVRMDEEEELARLAFDAVKHYAELPPVRFFFSLPGIDQAIVDRCMSPAALLVDAYKATEALLLEIWDEIEEGALITDERVKSRACSLIRGFPQPCDPAAITELPQTARIDGARFALTASPSTFIGFIENDRRGALFFHTSRYRELISDLHPRLASLPRRSDLLTAVLLCAGCLWQFPGSYRMALFQRGRELTRIPDATPGYEAFGETGLCPLCGAADSVMVYEEFPAQAITLDDIEAIRAHWRDLGRSWWTAQTQSQSTCSRCQSAMARDGGFLFGSRLVCSGCIDRELAAGLDHLRENPHHYGAALLRKVRAAGGAHGGKR